MSQLNVNHLYDTAGGSGVVVHGVLDTPLGMRNKIINGKMEIAQRGTTFTSPSSNTYTADRWEWAASYAGAVTITQSTDVPSSEFQSSLRIAVTTADATVAAGDIAFIRQKIEGFNARDLIGRTFTISFWVRSSKTGTHSVGLRNSGTDRAYVLNYTVNAVDTWEHKTLTVIGGLITAGTWNWTTGVGLDLLWNVMSPGTTFQTTAGAWQTGNFYGTAQVNVMDTVGNIFAITGVQLEVGENATPFEHRFYGTEVSLCWRYYYEFGKPAANDIVVNQYSSVAGNALYFPYLFPVEMRAAATGVVAGTWGYANASGSGITATATAFRFHVLAAGAGHVVMQNSGSNSRLTFSAEL